MVKRGGESGRREVVKRGGERGRRGELKEWSVCSAGLVHLCVVLCLYVVSIRDTCIVAWKLMHMHM